MQSRKVWKFISDGPNSREIIVTDEDSARRLAEILCLDKVRWRLQSEEELVPETATQMMARPSESASECPQAVIELNDDELLAPPPGPVVLAMASMPPPPGFRTGMPPAPSMPKMPKERPERRGARRFETRLRIILMNQTRTFRAFTQDLSLGGARLDRAIPTEILGSRCRVLIGDAEGRHNVAMECEILKDRNSARRLKFAGISIESSQELERWLAKAAQGQVPGLPKAA